MGRIDIELDIDVIKSVFSDSYTKKISNVYNSKIIDVVYNRWLKVHVQELSSTCCLCGRSEGYMIRFERWSEERE